LIKRMPGGRPKGKAQADAVKSITKVLDILEHLGSSKRVVSVSDLARKTKINVSTAYRLLQTLMARGYVVQEQTNRGYVIGPRFFQLGSAYLEGSDLATIAQPYLEALRDAVHETAYLVIFSQGEIVQLCKSDGKQAVSASARSMVREPAYCTATGKVLLSGRAPDELKKYLERIELRAYTPQTETNKTRLLREIHKVGQVGFAVDIEEFVPNLCCVSVPVRDGEAGAIVAAISIAMPKMRFKRTQVPRWCTLLRDKAQLISQQLGLMDSW
jgi:IclR family KDG regulon transcriptional repressor